MHRVSDARLNALLAEEPMLSDQTALLFALAHDVRAHRNEIARLQGQTHFDPNEELQAKLEEANALLAAVRPVVRWSVSVWDWLWDGRCSGSEEAWELSEMAEKCGLAERVAYDPDEHGESEVDEGDTILYPSALPAHVREWAEGGE